MEAARFYQRVDVEMKRAERYSVFLSLIVLDLSFLSNQSTEDSPQLAVTMCERIKDEVRVIDEVSMLENSKIGLLLPETPRQGAEQAARRITEMLKQNLSGKSDDQVISLEMASYPDAAGARTIGDFLSDHPYLNQN